MEYRISEKFQHSVELKDNEFECTGVGKKTISLYPHHAFVKVAQFRGKKDFPWLVIYPAGESEIV